MRFVTDKAGTPPALGSRTRIVLRAMCALCVFDARTR